MSEQRTSKQPVFRCKYPNNCDCCPENQAAFEHLIRERDDQRLSTQNAIDNWQACIDERDRLRILLKEGEQFIRGFAHSAESGFARQARALKWLKQYEEALAGAADETDDDYGAPCSRCGKITCECS